MLSTEQRRNEIISLLHAKGQVRVAELAERFGFCGTAAVYDLGERAATVIGFCFDCIHRAGADNLDLLSEAALLYVLSHLKISEQWKLPLVRCTMDISKTVHLMESVKLLLIFLMKQSQQEL